MHFFLYQIVARVVAAYLLVTSVRAVRRGLAERKIKSYSTDLILLLLDWSDPTVSRDAAPVSYWMAVGSQAFSAAACLVIIIFGWFPAK